MRLQIRTPGDVETMEFAAFDRVPPGPGEIEVAVTASSVNFADVLVAFGRYPSFEGYRQRLGTDFAGVVTAVGPDVTEHRVGDHVGGMSPNGCWSTFVTCDARHAVAASVRSVPTRGGRRAHRVRDRVVRPARSGQDLVGRQGADPLRDRRRGAGGDRDRPCRGSRDLRDGG